MSYDVRDRARMLRGLLRQEGRLSAAAASIFLPDKHKPTVESSFKDRQQFTVGTLSSYLGVAASGYRPLPAPPATAAKLRDFDEPEDAPVIPSKDKTFYSEPNSSGSGSSSSSDSDSSSSEESSDNENERRSSPTLFGKEEINNEEKHANAKKTNNYSNRSSNSGTSDSESDSGTSSGSGSGSDSDSSDQHGPKHIKNHIVEQTKPAQSSKSDKSNLELLLELDAVASSLPTMTPTCGGLLSPAPTLSTAEDEITPVGPSLVPARTTTLVPRVGGGGLAATSRWARAPHLHGARMVAVELTFHNHSADDVTQIRVQSKSLSASRAVHEFPPVSSLAPGAAVAVTLGVDFADSIQPIDFTILSSLGEVSASITPPVGELMRAVSMTPARWAAEQLRLRGMTECDKKAVKLSDEQAICTRVFETANVCAITSTGDYLRFAGRMMSSQDLVLLSVKLEEDGARVTANCPNMAVASLLANQIAQAFAKP